MGLCHSARRTIDSTNTEAGSSVGERKRFQTKCWRDKGRQAEAGDSKQSQPEDQQNREKRCKEKRAKASEDPERSSKKKCPDKNNEVADNLTVYTTKRDDRVKEPPEVAAMRKRWSKRSSYLLADNLSKKERQKLRRRATVLALNGSSFINAMLKIHNSYRADHRVPALKMNKKLNKVSQKLAELLVKVERRGKFVPHDIKKGVPSIPSNVIRNTFTGDTDNRTVPSAALVCSRWYALANHFNYDFQSEIRRESIAFMNMIWKGTTEMGSGRAVSGTGKVVIVALYYPKPQIPEGIKDNVHPPISSNITQVPNSTRTSNEQQSAMSKPIVNINGTAQK